jgi:hypothetical protein
MRHVFSAGKSSLINALRADDEREAEAGRRTGGVTKSITEYRGKTINGQPLLLLDTPGVGDEDRANSTKNPSPRIDPRERPADPGWNGKEGTKARIKKEPNAQVLCRKNLDFFPDNRQTPARREARNHRSEDAKMLGPPPCGPQRTGRADQRDARGDANRGRITQNRRRRPSLEPILTIFSLLKRSKYANALG